MEIEATSLTLKNLHVKFPITNDRSISERVQSFLLQIRDNEAVLIDELIYRLEQSK